MASSGKKKTTMAKLNREHRLRERRLQKQAKKDARKHAQAEGANGAGGELEAPEGGSTPTEEPAPGGELAPTAGA